MQVIRAAAMGMCFGVRHAIEAALKEPDPSSITILGELVHNEEVLAQLERRGYQMLPETERERIPATPGVMITAHGISDHERRRYEAAGKRLIDTSCPLVRRIHAAALALEAQGRLVLVIGKREHVEVRGLIGDLARCEVIGKIEEVRTYTAERLGVICQSTVAPETAQAILGAIRAHNHGKDICYVPTICRPTLERQAAVAELLRQVEALVVVGGHHSNNTLALVRQAVERGIPCLHVQSEDDLAPEWLHGYETVGLTAGTSTPDATIEAVYQRLLAIAAASPGGAMRQIA